ncbi:MICOS complex subunit MIC60 [Juglans microcarpa x Juglans regia]|uniref:MICOS complex subunit MIC60 n=1 Tax=Juglans microcarpa x Juglans regia TaxID=2249226 RepID=UPI001B7D9C7E|nr:MICOS complex subunit MIC60 [Juglans microcarpa x Juglans regia]
MLRRSVLEISSLRALRRIPRQITTQIPTHSSRKEFSTRHPQNASSQPGSAGRPHDSGFLPKLIVGSVAIGAAFFAAYQTGYLDQFLNKEQHSSFKEAKVHIENRDPKDIQHSVERLISSGSKEPNKLESQHPGEQLVSHESEEANKFSPTAEHGNPKVEDLKNHSQVQDKSDIIPGEDLIPIQEKDSLKHSQISVESNEQSADSGISSEGSPDIESTEEDTGKTQDGIDTAPAATQVGAVLEESDMKTLPPEHLNTENRPEDVSGNDLKSSGSLLEAYSLRDQTDHSAATSLKSQGNNESNTVNEALISAAGELSDAYISKDGKLVLDFLESIHAAEERQAELDARVFAEEKRVLKEKYERNLKDASARELMRAEEAAMLDKELKREKSKAAHALKSLQEKLEEKLKMELEQKENEAELKLNKLQEFAKAELAAAIASEKAAQIEKMAEANLHINALCMAFYARSEEARQSHFAHKLALGAVALEDALSKGLPIQTEIDALRSYLDSSGKDSVLDLVLYSLPEETLKNGADTPLQLNHKFDALKGTLRHFSLIPPGGGGILAHSLAHVASLLKVKEVDQSGDGIESVINRVENYMREGKLAEAADALEEGVRDTQAAEIVGDWVRQVRNRAITEQALILLQSYATAISLS